jgi:hypothetical protein
MTSTAALSSDAFDVRSLDAGGVLSAAVDRRRVADRAEAELLALAVHWVDLHPVLDDSVTPSASGAASWPVVAPLRVNGVEVEAPLAGAGTPPVAEFAVEELATALGMSQQAGLALVADALELCYRLPRLWSLVQDGSLQAWKARQVTHLTTGLSAASVAFVDRHTATTARHNTLPNLRHLVHEARLQCDPDQAAAVEQVALEARGVWFDHRASTATTDLTARLDTLDAIDLENTVADLATTLGRLGDTRHLDTRRATALGMLADPQRTLDLVTGTHPGGDTGKETGDDTGSAGSAGSTRWPNRSSAVLYLHVTTTDLATSIGTGCGGGRVEKLGPATLDLLRDWLHRLDDLSIRPVLDMNRVDAVDTHDPPAWMREQVLLRDRHCVFPGCTRDARACDLDHTDPYRPPDEGGPPGQTHPEPSRV